MKRKVGLLGLSATVVRISAGIIGGVLAGYFVRDYVGRKTAVKSRTAVAAFKSS